MSIWDWVSGKGELDVFNKYGGNQSTNFAGGIVNKMTGNPSAKDKRAQQQSMNDQIKAYRDQSELAQQQINEAKSSQDIEKRRIQEKQIRSLRRSYRPAGILGQGAPAADDVSNQLGG